MTQQPIIQLDHVYVSYGSKQVLTDVSLTIRDHDF